MSIKIFSKNRIKCDCYLSSRKCILSLDSLCISKTRPSKFLFFSDTKSVSIQSFPECKETLTEFK